MNKLFKIQINDVYPLSEAWAAYNKLDHNSTASEDVAAVEASASAIVQANNLALARRLYLQGLKNWAQNEDQRIGLNLPQEPQRSLLDYCRNCGVGWSQELAEESMALAAENYRPREIQQRAGGWLVKILSSLLGR